MTAILANQFVLNGMQCLNTGAPAGDCRCGCRSARNAAAMPVPAKPSVSTVAQVEEDAPEDEEAASPLQGPWG
jgi:hypothetical protein